MSASKEQIIDRLITVPDPDSTGERSRDIVSARRVSGVSACEGYVSLKIDPGDADEADRASLRARIEEAVHSLGEIKKVRVDFAPGSGGAAAVKHPADPDERNRRSAATRQPTGAPEPEPAEGRKQAASDQGTRGESQKAAGQASARERRAGAPQSPQHNARADNPLPRVRHVIAVGAGKGGVGKSTVAVNMALSLARRGLKVGLLDGDIYGPSTPTLLGLADAPLRGTNKTLFPFEKHGIRSITIGKMVDPEKPLIWRGPMAHGAFRQLATQTEWGDLDYLIIDLPPGTGDVPLTLAQMLPLSGAVIVCTPQKVAQDDAVRAAAMFRQLDVEVLGVVENMSYFIGDDGKEYDIFGRGGAAAMAERLGVPVLGTIPIHMELRENSDAGNPTANFEGNEQLATELGALGGNLVREVEARAEEAGRPTMSIS